MESLHLAVVQFAVYRAVLRRLDPGRTLFLAVPDDAYARIFEDELGRFVVHDAGINFLVHQVGERMGLRWIG
jgi:XisH protein